MKNHNFAQMMADAWDARMRLTENQFKTTAFNDMLGVPRVTYRAHLDRVRVNIYGEIIPRIAIVRDNIARLGKPLRKPRLPD